MNKIQKRTMQGFTLIELMIVIAILGILMAIAIPAYQDYAVRAKAAEGINLAGATKLAVAETYSSKGTMPITNASAGVPAGTSITGKYVTSVTVGTGGLISVAYNGTSTGEPKLLNGILLLSPTTTAGSVRWKCKSTTVSTKYLPSECR